MGKNDWRVYLVNKSQFGQVLHATCDAPQHMYELHEGKVGGVIPQQVVEGTLGSVLHTDHQLRALDHSAM